MGRTTHDEVAEAARQRLELLRRELQHDGVGSRTDSQPRKREDEPAGVASDSPCHPSSGPSWGSSSAAPDRAPAALAPAGRHSRASLRPRARIAAWLSERVPATLRGRVRLGAGEFGALALVLGVGLALAGVMAIRAGGDSSSPASARVSTSVEPGTVRGGEPLITPASPGATASSDTATVIVDVAGKVRRPGVITLPAGSRVVDAIDKAGGVARKVDLSGLNLARVLVDGEQVLVGEAPAPGVAAGAASSAGVPAPGALLNLNTATLEQLDALPGVGPVTAQKILGWRQQHGRFSSVDELLEVDGIGEKTLADLAPMVTL